MAKYLIEIDEVPSCFDCPFFCEDGCLINEDIDIKWEFLLFIHKDCPLKKV